MKNLEPAAAVFYLAIHPELRAYCERLFLRRAKVEEAQRHAAGRVAQAATQTAALAKLNLAAGHLAFELHMLANLCAGSQRHTRTVFVAQG